MPEDEPCWIYCNPFVLSAHYEEQAEDTIFLAFDRGSHRHFDSVRMIVLQSEAPETIIVGEKKPKSQKSFQHLNGKDTTTPLTRGTNFPDDPNNEHSRVATIVLQPLSGQTKVEGRTGAYPCLLLRFRSMFKPVGDASSIAYSRTFPVSDDNKNFISKQSRTATPVVGATVNMGYHILVLPTSYQSSVPKTLAFPATIITSIVENAVDWRCDYGWAKTVLSVALVSKTWLPALSAFWKHAGTGEALIRNLAGLTRCLRIDSSNRRHFTRFVSYRMFSIEPEFELEGWSSYQNASQAIGTFFQGATEVQTIQIGQTLFAHASLKIKSLQKVEYLHIEEDEPYFQEPGVAKASKMGDILDVVRDWKKLTSLSIECWSDDLHEDIERMKTTPILSPASYSLKDLDLRNVTLINISELESSDFLNFLRLIALTVEKMELLGLESITEKSLGAETALDVSIADMPSLSTLQTEWPVLTHHGISRKACMHTRAELRLYEYPYSLVHGQNISPSLEEVIRCGEGKWTSIVIFPYDGPEPESKYTKESHRIRMERLQEAADDARVLLTLPDSWE